MRANSTLYHEITQHKDFTTGEIKEETSKKIVKKNTPDFIMLFTQTSSALRNSQLTAAQSTILFTILTGGFILRDNRLDLSSGAREELVETTKFQRNTVNKCIQVLVEKEIVLKGKKRNDLSLNPFIFGKGHFSDLEKLRLETSFEYDFTNLELNIQEKSKGFYKGHKDLSEKPHEIKQISQYNDNGVDNVEVEVSEIPQNATEFVNEENNEDIIDTELSSTRDLELEIRKIEATNREKELENEQLKLKIELLMLQNKAL